MKNTNLKISIYYEYDWDHKEGRWSFHIKDIPGNIFILSRNPYKKQKLAKRAVNRILSELYNCKLDDLHSMSYCEGDTILWFSSTEKNHETKNS